MVNNKKVYSKLLLLIIVVLAVMGTQSLAATISRVTGLKSEIASSTEVKLSWNKISNVTGYEVYIKESGKNYQSIGKTNMNSNIRINNLTAGKTYYVKVRAYKGNSVGSFSNEIRVSTTNSSSINLAKVTNLRQTGKTTNSAEIAWNSVTNATGYEVYVREQNGSYVNAGRTTNLYVTLNGLVSGRTYYVKVRAYNGSRVGDFSNELKITVNNSSTTNLAKVINLRQTGKTTNSAEIAWNSVTNATGYEVYVREQNGSYVNAGRTTNLYVTLNGLVSGRTYYVKVRAYNGSRVGDFSNELKIVTSNTTVEVTLGKVTNLRINNVTENSANITWNAVTNATGYEVYVRIQNGSYVNKGTTTNLYATLRGLAEGTRYDVKVRAYRAENGRTVYGDFSDEIRFNTTKQTEEPSITLGKVMNLKATLSGTRANLSWDTVTNSEGYEVYIDIPGRGYISLGKVTGNNVGIIGLEVGKSYNVKIRAYKGTAYGEFSDEVKVATKTEAELRLGKVENLNSVVTGTTTSLTWNAVENATRYEVYINIPGRGYISLGTTRTNAVRVISLSKGITYQIKVRAIGNINGSTVYGEFSNEINVMAR